MNNLRKVEKIKNISLLVSGISFSLLVFIAIVSISVFSKNDSALKPIEYLCWTIFACSAFSAAIFMISSARLDKINNSK